MAKMNYEHVYGAAGFSGDRWDVNLGYNLSYASIASDVTFAIGKTITLAAGTWPAWVVPGKQIKVNTALNPNTVFTVYEVISTSQISVVETPVAEAGVTVTFNGSIDTLIQDTLLKDLAPLAVAHLTEDTPHLLVSSGALGANKILNISALEVESASRGGKPLRGRFFQFSVQNSDVNNSNTGKTITVQASGLINGASTFVISTPNDYWFTHDENGNWIVTIMPAPSDKLASMKRVSFTASMWGAHPTMKNTIKIPQTGTPTPGSNETVAHELANYTTYIVQVWNTEGTRTEIVDVEVQVDKTTGDIYLQKAERAQPFTGVVDVVGSLD